MWRMHDSPVLFFDVPEARGRSPGSESMFGLDRSPARTGQER